MSPRTRPPLALLAAAVLLLAGCGGMPSPARTLSYSLVPYKGGPTAHVSDTRTGKHTVWVVLLNPPTGRRRELVAFFNHGDGAGGSYTTAPIPAGVYHDAIYGADGVVYAGGAKYWTPAHRVGGGQVTVP